MKRHKKSVRMSMMAGASAAAIAISLFGAGAAQAAGQRVSADCATTGAFGILHLKEGDSPYSRFIIWMQLKDTLADGHHVKIRFLSKRVGSSATVKWRWNSQYLGAGPTLDVETEGQDKYGIAASGIEVARFDGGTKLNSCTAWT
ncbi:hypothetical protein OHT20_32735 [Streptomyces caniferus]|uniref:hypothetical protein n=1 Tax=Streptomyces caniferus TaxID=285557 RepID=UPI002E2BD8B0|nr:hypothetical protein [Streptomyces caniferus]